MEDVAIMILHRDCDFAVDNSYECPLGTKSRFTLAAAQESASKGCPRCILRFMAVKQTWPELSISATIECSHDYVFLPFWVQSYRLVLAWLDDSVGEEARNSDEPVVCSFYGQKMGGIDLVERLVPCDTASEHSLETIRAWIKRCNDDHDCAPKSRVPSFPRRVLDVRDNQVRLYETNDQGKTDKYACLSHRWGASPETMFRTTQATFSSFKEDIPWASLPRTFQDAISVTRKLHLGFLWIDSLCIIQDDHQDWEQQSAKMATIYQNAYITLAATASDGPEGGCYTTDSSPQLHWNEAPLAIVRYQDGTERQLSARRPFDHNIHSLPLLSRGWVYQERVLSPRMLHFAGEELVWECGRSIDCECGAEDLANKFEHPRISDDDDENNNSYVGPVSGHPHYLRGWMQIVADYTALSLTKSNDIFPALSGIAKVFAAQSNDKYIAGLWKRTLVQNLLWYFTGEPIHSDPSTMPWRAPSWSWASVTSRSGVRFLPVVTQELAEVKEAVCEPSGTDPTGGLRSAHLILRTKAMPAYLELCRNDIDSVSPKYTIHLDRDFTIPKAPESLSHCLSTLRTGYFDLDDSRLSNNIEHLNIILAQIASGVEATRVWLHDIYPHIPFL
jgi:hypothetical protein